jgi:hypothetical protein
MGFPVDLTGQASILCSGVLTSFEEYQPIIYPYFPRRAGVSTGLGCELTIMPGGKFAYRLLNPVLDKNLVIYELQEAMLSSFSGWRFKNDTGQPINMQLTVLFELSGTVTFADDKAINQIAFDKNNITIKVIAAKIIPNFG